MNDRNKILLGGGRVAVVDESDFDFLNQWHWWIDGKYAVRIVKKSGQKPKRFYMHRVILNTPDGMETDHINGDKLDNRKSNLRICTRLENCHNRKKYRNGIKSKFKGVSVFKGTGRFCAYLRNCGKKIHLGYFDSEDDAARAYNEHAKRMFGEFARLNCVPELVPGNAKGWI